MHAKAEDFIDSLQHIYAITHQKLLESMATYKQVADRKRHLVEFEVSDFLWAILTKDHFPVGEYNKLSARKIGSLEVVEKINLNAYCLLSHIRTVDVFSYEASHSGS